MDTSEPTQLLPPIKQHHIILLHIRWEFQVALHITVDGLPALDEGYDEMDVTVLVVLFYVVKVGLFVVDWVQALLEQGFVVADWFGYGDLGDWNLGVVDRVDTFDCVCVGLVHCDCPFEALPAYHNTVGLIFHPFPYNPNNILDLMRIHDRTPAGPNPLTPIDQHQGQYRHIINRLNHHILLL